jgi:hypothetical protein
MTVKRKLHDARDKQRHCERLLESYDLVIDDLKDWDTAEWTFVRKRVEFMRADIAEEVENLRQVIVDLQAQCHHWFERIGEAKPPFEQCVECGLVGGVR